ncbi:MAG: cytochrome c oxidase assembly protein [Parvibaculaceae bacterium]
MRRLALATGLLVLTLIWGGPLLDVYRESFAAHMLAHMGVVAVAAPLVAVGLVGTRWDFSGQSALLAPVPASILELVVVWVWHAPVMRAMAEANVFVTALEQFIFLAAGLVLWLACIGRGRGDEKARAAAGAFGLLLTSVHMTLLGALLALSPRPLFGIDNVTCLGVSLTAQQDQEAGGVLMLLVGAAIYLAGGLALVARLVGQPMEAR